MKELILISHVVNASVSEGFLPAARKLGLRVVLLTDCAEQQRQHFSQQGLPAYPDEIVSCDVFNPIAVIEAISERAQVPVVIFSNSDHLQTSTAIAANYFALPGKDWRVTYRAKNKAQMRIGDMLLFPYAGAYAWHISHHDFLRHPHPQHHYLQEQEELRRVANQ